MLARTLILAALVPALAEAQIGPYGLVNSSVGHQMRGVSVADFDQDGLPDLLTTSLLDDRLVLYRGEGAGEFAPGRELTRDATGGAAAVVADLDADGTLDIVATTQNQVVLLRGTGAGNFAPPAVVLPVPQYVQELWVLDLDGDNRLDLVMQHATGVSVSQGTGGLNFTAPVVVYSTSFLSLNGVTVADLDADGLTDLAVVTRWEQLFNGQIIPGELEWVRQTAAGSFGAPVVLASGQFDAIKLLAYDADLDGDLDLIRAEGLGGSIFWYRNDGAGQFAEIGPPLMVIPGLLDLGRADLDGDGDEDLIYSTGGAATNRTVGELLLVGPATFVAGAVLTEVGYAPQHLLQADVDADGRPDIVHTVFYDDQLIWHPRALGGGFDAPREVTDRFSESFPEPPFGIADLDGDGGLDVVTLGSEIRVSERLADGSFGRSMPTPVTDHALQFPDLVDLDGDGNLDLLLGQWVPPAFDYVLEWAPRQAGAFGSPILIESFPSTQDFQGPRAVDFDGDGDLDVFTTSYTLAELRVYENLGGTFAPGLSLGTLTHAKQFPPEDVNGDGRPDIILGSINLNPGERTYVRLNLGTGQLGPLREIGGLATRVRDVTFVDLDGDGDREALRVEDTSGFGADVVLYENLGGAQFAPGTLLISDPVVGRYMRIQRADWDQDGRDDVMLLHESRRHISWYRQSGPLQLESEEILTQEMDEARGMRVVDLDGDADLDLVLADDGMRTLRTYENLREIGQSVCSSLPNSTGHEAELAVTGSRFASENATALTALGLPTGVFGYFIASPIAAPVPIPGINQGLLCLAGPIGRYNRSSEVQFSAEIGRFTLSVDLHNTPTPTGSVSIAAGQTWYFQAWYRDNNPGPTSNFTGAASVTFL